MPECARCEGHAGWLVKTRDGRWLCPKCAREVDRGEKDGISQDKEGRSMGEPEDVREGNEDAR